MSVDRFDRAAPITKITPVAGGGIRVDGALTRTGVMVYKFSDGSIRREYRPPEEVFAADSIASLRSAPVTELHPTEPVTAGNWRALSRGHVGDDVRAEQERLVVAPVVVQDADAIAGVQSRKWAELSCGYACELEMTAGTTPEGERYDAIQREIRYNHVALLPRGEARGGPEIRLRVDAATCIPSDMATHRIDGKDFEAGSPEHLAAVDKAIGHAAAAKIAAEKRADDAEAKLAAETKRADAAAKIAAAAHRARLVEIAHRYALDADAAAAEAGPAGDDAILMKILTKAVPGIDFGKLMLSHEQLMAMLEQVIGASTEAPAEGSAPPADGSAPPAAPPADSITALRALPAKPGAIKDDAKEFEKRREAAHEKRLNRWKEKA